jgi:hypothetical protein
LSKKALVPAASLALLLSLPALAQRTNVPFDAEHWVLDSAKVAEMAGRTALTGLAVLKGVEFQDGTISFDVWAPDVRKTGGRAYPGVMFRMASPGDTERLYIRPHRAGLYADAVQYAPVFNGVAGWQLYSGEGFTAEAAFPFEEWVPVRIEVAGRQARVFVGSGPAPVLEVGDLKRGVSKGAVALFAEGAAFFSNFSVMPDPSLRLSPPPPSFGVPGAIREWELSKGFPALLLESGRYPDAGMPGAAEWRKVEAAPNGLVDIARFVRFNGVEPETVFARTTLRSDGNGEPIELDFGYSDAVDIFLNGAPLFSADSSYRLRDPSFLGIAGYWDTVRLPLRKGDNELLLVVREGFGGWGFMARDGSAVFAAPGVAKAWETPKALRVPESAAGDPARDAVYVSVFDPAAPPRERGRQAVARIRTDGRDLEPAWVSGLDHPSGLAVLGDKLFVVERGALAEVDIPGAKVIRRTPVPNAVFLNDAAAEPGSGRVFVSDSGRGAILVLEGGAVSEFLAGGELPQPNGLLVDGGRLVVGTSGDGCLKAVDLRTKAVSVLARLGAGIVDGIASDGKGNLLVSQNGGRLFRVAGDGSVSLLLDTTTAGMNLADFCYCPASGLVVVPTYVDCRVAAFKIE